MGRKNSFLPGAMLKDKTYQELKSKNMIIWKDEAEHKTLMNDFIECIQTNGLPDSLINHAERPLSSFVDFRLIGLIEINKDLKLLAEKNYIDYMYLITDSEYKQLYLAIEKSAPIFWYHFLNKKLFFDQLDILVQTYNSQFYNLQHENKIRAFFGTEHMLKINFNELEDMLIVGSHTEILTWGSFWKDHPFREQYMTKTISKDENIQYSKYAMKQATNSVKSMSIRTAYSKSILTIEDYEGVFVITVSYDPIYSDQINLVNSSFGREYPTDLPIEVVITCINFPFLGHLGLLKLRPVTSHNFMIATLVSNSKEMYNEQIINIKQLIENDSKTGEKNIEDNDEIVLLLKELETRIALNHILEDENIEEFIGQKIINLRKRTQNYKTVKSEVFDMIDGKLSELEFTNKEELRDNIALIIRRILKFGL
jgi:hypothetical protein